MFRQANENDVDLILSFINKLAVYEKRPEDVSATPDLIRKWLFEEKLAHVIFLLEDDKEVGFALYYYNFSTFKAKPSLYLEDLYVLDSCRNKGYGKKLIYELAKISLDFGANKMEWSCLAWNQASIDFYLRLNATIQSESVRFELSYDELLKIKSM